MTPHWGQFSTTDNRIGAKGVRYVKVPMYKNFSANQYILLHFENLYFGKRLAFLFLTNPNELYVRALYVRTLCTSFIILPYKVEKVGV